MGTRGSRRFPDNNFPSFNCSVTWQIGVRDRPYATLVVPDPCALMEVRGAGREFMG